MPVRKSGLAELPTATLSCQDILIISRPCLAVSADVLRGWDNLDEGDLVFPDGHERQK